MRAILYIYSLFLIAAANNWAQIKWEWANPPTTSNTLYTVSVLDSLNIIGFGEAGTMLKTTDAGESWFIKYQNQIYEDINVSHFFNRLDGIVACSGGKIYTTRDGGSNWDVVETDTEENLLALDFFDNQNGAAAGNNGAVLITSDGGMNWNILNKPAEFSFNGIDHSQKFITVVGSRGNIYQFEIETEEWFKRKSGVLFDLHDTEFIDEFAIAVGDSGTALVSKDYGVNWEYQKIAKGRNIYDVEIKLSGEIICASERGLTARADIKDLNWKNRYTGSIYDIHAIDLLDDNYGGMVGQYGNLHATKNGFSNWIFFFDHSGSTYKNLYSVKIENDTFAIVTGWNGTLMQTLDYGDTWFKSSAKGADEYRGIDIIRDSLCWAVGEDGVIRYSENRGSSWEAVYSKEYHDLNAIKFLDDNYGLIAGNKGTLFETVNGGNEWNEVQLGIEENLNSITYDKTGRPTIVGDNGLIFQKQNNSWVYFRINGGGNLKFVENFNGVFITGGVKGILLRSVDDGKNWEKIETGLNVNWNAADFFSEDLFLIAGNKGHLIESTDKGITWKKVYVPTNQDIHGIDVISPERGFLVGLHGTLLRIKK